MNVNWLDRALFVSSHYFTLCTTEKLYAKTMKHLRIPKADRPAFLLNWHSDATAHYFENQGERTKSVVVCLPVHKDKTTSQIVALICHEAVHIWQQVRKSYGETDPSPELEAYAIQSLTQRLYEEYERQAKK